MKGMLKMITPPFIWDGLRRLLKKETNNFTFHGQHHSFQDVFAYYPQATDYHSDKSKKLIIESATELLRKFESNELSDFGWESFRLNVLPTIIPRVGNINKPEKVRICDVGGGLGSLYVNIRMSCKDLNIEYTVVELAETAQAGKSIFSDYSNIQFVSEFPSHKENFDVVYFGSSLQYFENYEQVIETVCAYGANMIVLTDHPMSKMDTFVCAQVNMENRAIPVYIFNIDDMIRTFDQNGYQISTITKSYYPFHDLSNYKETANNIGFYNLFFNKI